MQHGTQSRSSRQWAQDWPSSAKSGKLRQAARLARPVLQGRRPAAARAATSASRPTKAPPAELDFNLWLGPAPEQPYHDNLVHYNWHWFWDFGNGDIGNQGVHEMDMRPLGDPRRDAARRRVISLGGRFGYEDQGETPNARSPSIDYGETQLIFEVRGLKTQGVPAARASATSSTSRQGVVAGGQVLPEGEGGQASRSPQGRGRTEQTAADHFGNFIDGVRSRKIEDLNADILEGGTSPPASATWPTSPTGWARRCRSRREDRR